MSAHLDTSAESTPVTVEEVDLGLGSRALFVGTPADGVEVFLEGPDFVSSDDDKGDAVVALRSWLYDGGKALVSVLVTRDQGSDHPIHHLEPAGEFRSDLGTWVVSDIGGGDGRYVTAVLVVEDLVLQVTGNGAPLGDIEAVARSIKIGVAK